MNKGILNILNGQAMYNYFKQNHLDNNGVYVPFNEAMCVGRVTKEIFSNQFNKNRCQTHNLTMDQYNEMTLEPLRILFEKRFSNIVLWFDDDMFCQINLLTILAYLDQIGYDSKIIFNLVDRKFRIVDCFEFRVNGYYETYKQVMIVRCVPNNISLQTLENGIKLYFEYLKEDNEITEYIRQHDNLETNVLLAELLNRFSKYGLGDTQYIQLITGFESGHIGKVRIKN